MLTVEETNKLLLENDLVIPCVLDPEDLLIAKMNVNYGVILLSRNDKGETVEILLDKANMIDLGNYLLKKAKEL